MAGPRSNPHEREAASPALDVASLDMTEEAIDPIAGARKKRAGGLTPDGRLRAGRLAGLSLRHAIWVLYWPIVLESLLTSLVGMTDTYLSAQISVHATDAIGGASYLLWFMGLVVMAVGVGATALISRSIGAGRFAVANAALGQTMLLAVIAGIGLALIMAGVAMPAARILKLGPEAAQAFRQYMQIVAIGVPFTAVLASGTACARGAGDSFRPLVAMVVVNIINMIASWAISGVDLARSSMVDGEVVTRVILENPFSFDLGVRGIAWGTVLSSIVGSMIVLVILIRGTGKGAARRAGGVRLRAKRLRPHWHTMRRLIRVGLPNFFETFGMWAGNFAIIMIVGRMGSEGLLGSHIVAIRLESFSFGPGFSMGMVASILAGQYLGAGSMAMAKRAILVATGVAAAQMGAMGVIFMTLPRTVVGLVSSQPEHLEMVPQLLVITGAVQVPFAIAIALRVGMRGAGDAKWVMYLTWLTTYGVRLPLVYLCSRVDIILPDWLGGFTIHNPSPVGGTLRWVWIALCTEILARALVFGIRFYQGAWATKRV